MAKREARAEFLSREIIEVLGSLHDYFNSEFFIPKKTPLPMPVFTISGGKKRAGHFIGGKWYSMSAGKAQELAEEIAKGNKGASILRAIPDATKPDEMNIHSEVGLNKTFESVAATVWTLMCGQAQFHYPGSYGAPGKGSYHNKAWHTLARESGLDTFGLNGQFRITPAFLSFLSGFPDEPERWAARIPNAQTQSRNKQLLWKCKCKKIRAAVKINVQCLDCGSRFKQIDADVVVRK